MSSARIARGHDPLSTSEITSSLESARASQARPIMSPRPLPEVTPSVRKLRMEVRRFAGTAKHAEQLSNLRIVHLTDLHFGRVTPLVVQRQAVELANQARPDLVVITGDFVCHSQLYLDQMVETLGKLEAPAVAVLGNHDYWSGGVEVARALRKGRIEVLRNANTTITLAHQRLQIVGLDDAYTGHDDREKALKGLRRDIAAIGLSHIAEEADPLWERGVPLVFAGHTHAGQVTLARLHELALGRIVGHKYVHGLYGRRQGPQLGAVYVGAGIGAAVMPLRIGERGRREVAIFDLGHDVEDFEEHHEEQAALEGRKPSPEVVAKRQEYVHKRELQREVRAAKRYLSELKKAGRGFSMPPPPTEDLEKLDGPAFRLDEHGDLER